MMCDCRTTTTAPIHLSFHILPTCISFIHWEVLIAHSTVIYDIDSAEATLHLSIPPYLLRSFIPPYPLPPPLSPHPHAPFSGALAPTPTPVTYVPCIRARSSLVCPLLLHPFTLLLLHVLQHSQPHILPHICIAFHATAPTPTRTTHATVVPYIQYPPHACIYNTPIPLAHMASCPHPHPVTSRRRRRRRRRR